MAGTFPPDFLWGASTASYQIEGAAAADGRGESIWDRFCATPGRVAGGDTGDVACDHYHRYREDVALMAALGLKAYRFSIAWPRVLPAGTGAVNAAGLDFYDRLIDALLEVGIAPWPCLYHWDLPQALEDRGGWRNRDIARWFGDYAAAVAGRLADRVDHIATLNEPNVFTLMGHSFGVHAPGLCDELATLAAIHNINLAHGEAVRALRAARADLAIGSIHAIQPVAAVGEGEADRAAQALYDALWNWAFPDPQILGRYPDPLAALLEPVIEPGDLERIQVPLEFLRTQPLHSYAGALQPLRALRRRRPAAARGGGGHRHGLGDRPGRLPRGPHRRQPALSRPADLRYRKRRRLRGPPRGRSLRRRPAGRLPAALPGPPCRRPVPRVPTSAAISSGPCWTTSNGSSATPSASGSFTSITTI